MRISFDTINCGAWIRWGISLVVMIILAVWGIVEHSEKAEYAKGKKAVRIEYEEIVDDENWDKLPRTIKIKIERIGAISSDTVQNIR